MTEREYLKELGEKIRGARKRKRISVQALSRMCGMDYSNFSRIQCGKKNPQILTLRRIAEALGIDVKKLI